MTLLLGMQNCLLSGDATFNFAITICQVCVDIFLTTQTYVDIASISVVPSTTGGQVKCTNLI